MYRQQPKCSKNYESTFCLLLYLYFPATRNTDKSGMLLQKKTVKRNINCYKQYMQLLRFSTKMLAPVGLTSNVSILLYFLFMPQNDTLNDHRCRKVKFKGGLKRFLTFSFCGSGFVYLLQGS